MNNQCSVNDTWIINHRIHLERKNGIDVIRFICLSVLCAFTITFKFSCCVCVATFALKIWTGKFQMVNKYGVCSYVPFPTIFVVNVFDFLPLLCAIWNQLLIWWRRKQRRLEQRKLLWREAIKSLCFDKASRRALTRSGAKRPVFSTDALSLYSEKMETCKNWAQNTRAATSDRTLRTKERKDERKSNCICHVRQTSAGRQSPSLLSNLSL